MLLGRLLRPPGARGVEVARETRGAAAGLSQQCGGAVRLQERVLPGGLARENWLPQDHRPTQGR